MRKVIITGISGFVGTNLKKYLERDYEIIGVGRHEGLNYENFTNIEYDAVIHLAGKAHDLKKGFKSEEYNEANFELTRKIFNAFLISNASTFIFVSSVKAVADDVESILTESAIPNPKTPYGVSKLMAENYILSNAISGKRIYILRPCMIHGIGNKGNLNLLFKFVKTRFPYPLGAFDNHRSFLSIQNFCFIIYELLKNNEINSGVYNLADDETLSSTDLIMLIGKALNKSPTIWNIPPTFIRNIAKIGSRLKLPLTIERLNKLTKDYVVSNKKIKDAIGVPLPISLEAGIIETITSLNES